MLPVANHTRTYIKSLLRDHSPIICCSAIPQLEQQVLIISLFAEIHNILVPPVEHQDIRSFGAGQKFTMDDARSLVDFSSFSSTSLPAKLAFIFNIELLTDDQCNALLKVVEESGGNALNIVFLSNQVVSVRANYIPGVLQTILSRCSVVFLPADDREAKTLIEIKSDLWSARYASGSSQNAFVVMMTKVAKLIIKDDTVLGRRA